MTDHRTVLIDVANCPRMGTRTGMLFLPDRLHLEWRDGALTMCSLHGRRMRTDGMEWLDGRRDGRAFLHTVKPPPYRLDDDTPEWVRDLVRIHQPKG